MINVRLLLYYLLFFLFLIPITDKNIILSLIIPAVIYGALILFALSSMAESLMRLVYGVRPLRISAEKLRLYPLFMKVYLEATRTDPALSKDIKLYIKESDLSINAFAFGTSTLVITRGSLEFLSDECLRGLMAHELGHFSNQDPIMALFATVSNLLFSLWMIFLNNIRDRIDDPSGKSTMMFLINIVFYIIYFPFRFLEIIDELLLIHKMRNNEYKADLFALNCGFGEDMIATLMQIYQMTISKPQSIRALIKETHPPLTKRIEKLETELAIRNKRK